MKNLFQKKWFRLVLISIVLLCTLEFTLWGAGLLLTGNPKSHPQIPEVKAISGTRILALGESTSFPNYHPSLNGKAWPEKLESKLQQDNLPVHVLNLSYPALTTNEIIPLLDEAIQKYRPEIVISMIGINDSDRWTVLVAGSPLKRLRSFRVASWLYYKLEQIFHHSSPTNENILQSKKLAAQARARYSSVESASKETIQSSLKDYKEAFGTGFFPREYIGDYAWILSELDLVNDCVDLFTYTFREKIPLLTHELMSAQDCLEHSEYSAVLLSNNEQGVILHPMKNALAYNLKHIDRAIIDSGAYHIVMSYPLKSSKENEALYGNDPRRPFVENESGFQKLLREHQRGDVFLDNFGGDFGHPTSLGQEAIAENLLPKVREIILNTKAQTAPEKE